MVSRFPDLAVVQGGSVIQLDFAGTHAWVFLTYSNLSNHYNILPCRVSRTDRHGVPQAEHGHYTARDFDTERIPEIPF
jgi:hypothetical protein